MKKTISIVLLLALCLSLFSGCNLFPQPQPADSNLERAKALVFNAYKPAKKDEVPVKSADFEVMTAVLVDGETFPVAWTVEVTSGPADAVQLVDGSSDGFKKVDLTEKPEEDVLFTLTATLSDSEGNTATVSFNFKTLKFEAPTAGKVVIKLPKTGAYATGTEYKYNGSTPKLELVLSETKAEAIAFTMIENADNTVTFKTDDGYFLSCDATNVEFVTAESDYTKFVLEATDGGYFIKCAVASFKDKPQYLEVYSGYLTCYGMDSAKADIYTFELENADGAAGTVKKFSDSTDTTDPTETTTPSAAQLPEVTSPVEGTAYKFGMIQVNNGHTVYIAGGIDQDRYLVTTTDKAAALDVYVVAVDGGYKFKVTIDGAEQYITMGMNAANKTALSYTAEGTVWQFNPTLSVWYANLDGTDYYMGAYNTFDTISLSKTSYINEGNKGVSQFPAGFFDATISTDPTDPTDPTEPTAPTEPAYVTNPEVGKTYKLGLYQTNKSAVYYFTGAMSGYYGATETDKATAVDVTLEDAGDGKFHICFTVGGAKNYIYGEASGTHLNFKFGETKGVFTWDAENSTFTTVIGETTVFMGTYNNYVTFGMSDIAKIGTSYAAHLYN